MNERDETRTVVVATDGSGDSRVAVEQGVRLAEALGTTVTFLSVRKPPFPVLGDPYYQRAVTKDLQRARRSVAEAVEIAEERGVEAEGDVIEGIPAPEIILFARERGAELIVVGCRGFGAIKSAVLGSVSTAVVHHADRPVLVARRAPAVESDAARKVAVGASASPAI